MNYWKVIFNYSDGEYDSHLDIFFQADKCIGVENNILNIDNKQFIINGYGEIYSVEKIPREKYLSEGKGGEWTILEKIPPGSIFETEDGTKAVKTEYKYSNDIDSQCQCILLESGEYAHFEEKNNTFVKLIQV